MGSTAELIEDEGQWRLPYSGMQVIQLRVSYQLTLVLDGGAEVQLETDALLTEGGLNAPSMRLVPERQDVAPALALFGATVHSSVVSKTGTLRMAFSTGAHLDVEPDPQYEAWTARGPGGLLLVCEPGGGVAVWS